MCGGGYGSPTWFWDFANPHQNKYEHKTVTSRQKQKITGSNDNKVSPQTPNTSSENDHQKSPDLLVMGVYGAEETTGVSEKYENRSAKWKAWQASLDNCGCNWEKFCAPQWWIKARARTFSKNWSEVKVAQSCLTLRPHGLYSPWNSPGRILEWIAFPFSRESS